MKKQRCTNNKIKGMVDGYKCEIDLTIDYCNCECADFKYRRQRNNEYCKHLDLLYRDNVCPWGTLGISKKQTEEQFKKHICPLCGSDTLDKLI